MTGLSERPQKHSEQENSKIVKFKKRRQLNIGTIIFGIIFIYLIATIFMYIMKPNVTHYEVREGSLVKDYSYTGLAIRSEIPVYAESQGYINYYTVDNSKVKVGSTVYTLSNSKLDFGEETETEGESSVELLSEKEQKEIALQIHDFHHEYQESDFSNVYYLKENIITKLNQKESQNRLNVLNEMISQNAVSGISAYKASRDGIVSYCVDGLDGITIDNVVFKNLDRNSYKNNPLVNNMQISSGDAVYKLVTEDVWQLLILIKDEIAEALKDKSQVDVSFNKDGEILTADFEIVEKDGSKILCLTFQDSMIRYINERFLDVDLVIEDKKGLKIPKTATAEQEFFIVPKRYLTQGGNSSGAYLMVRTMNKDGSFTDQLVDPTIYYSTDEIVYLSMDEFQEGDIILLEESNETHKITEKRYLTGVFCINKGYAVFKPINILSESDDYYIIENGNRYSVSNYDHIALYSENLKENDIVF